ncbi:MAG: AAA family ATPase [Deferribacteraceae bacterium]|jgi:chromosome partitioning protein|nr:AAA family ATPase [Deferribacteraceae bacterium]
MGKVIAIANQKGGVGKTTTTINLGASLAQQGHKILMVDIDPQGNATSGIGIVMSAGQPSIYELLIGSANIRDTIVPSETNGLSVIPSRIDLSAAEVELVSANEREGILKSLLGNVLSEYDFILIDCPPSLGLLTVNALTAAQSVLIPLQCEYYAMEGLGQLMNTVRLIRENLNKKLALEGIVLTMYDQRNKLSREVMNQIREHFPSEAFQTIIPRNVRLSEAPSYGLPINKYDRGSVGAERYNDLAVEILDRNLQNAVS